MLTRLTCLSSKLKEALIKLGYALPPVVNIYNSKIKQLDFDFKQMASVVAEKRTDYLYTNAETLFRAITAEHFHIKNLTDLLASTEKTLGYILSY